MKPKKRKLTGDVIEFGDTGFYLDEEGQVVDEEGTPVPIKEEEPDGDQTPEGSE